MICPLPFFFYLFLLLLYLMNVNCLSFVVIVVVVYCNVSLKVRWVAPRTFPIQIIRASFPGIWVRWWFFIIYAIFPFFVLFSFPVSGKLWFVLFLNGKLRHMFPFCVSIHFAICRLGIVLCLFFYHFAIFPHKY